LNRYFLLTIIYFLSCRDIGEGYLWSDSQTSTFSKSFGSKGYDYGWNAAYSPFDNGIIITGRRAPVINGQSDLWAIKTDSRGILQWERSFGGLGNEDGYDVISTSDGGYLFVGQTWSFGDEQQVYAIKTDLQGNPIWEKTYGGSMWDVGHAVIQLKSGDFIISGYSNSPGISSGNTDVFLIKININGDIIWQKGYGNQEFPNHEWSYDILELFNSELLVVGARDRYSKESKNILIMNLDSEGNLIWEKELKEEGLVDEVGFSISPSIEEGFFICATVNKLESPLIYQPKIIKIDSFGNVNWKRTFKSIGNVNSHYSATATISGDLVIVGTSTDISNSKGLEDAFLMRIDSNGNILWSNAYGTFDNKDWGWSVFETNEQNIVFVGSTQSFGASLFDVFLVGTDAKGLIR
jgi:hypothetical protein